jgi:class 3 adenylate cyclase
VGCAGARQLRGLPIGGHRFDGTVDKFGNTVGLGERMEQLATPDQIYHAISHALLNQLSRFGDALVDLRSPADARLRACRSRLEDGTLGGFQLAIKAAFNWRSRRLSIGDQGGFQLAIKAR